MVIHSARSVSANWFHQLTKITADSNNCGEAQACRMKQVQSVRTSRRGSAQRLSANNSYLIAVTGLRRYLLPVSKMPAFNLTQGIEGF